MATLGQVARLAAALPDVVELDRRGLRTWVVTGRTFAWERPFTKADVERFGDAAPPDGPILAVRVADLDDKEATLAAHPESFFTIPHFDGFPGVLIQLRAAGAGDLREAITDAWLACAPPRLVAAFAGESAGRRRWSAPGRLITKS